MAKAKYSQWLLLNLLIGFLTASLAVSQPLNVKIINRNPNFPDSKVFLMFGGTSSGLNATATVNGVAGATLAEGASYALSQIDDIKLSSFRGGRIYIALGNRLTSASVDTGYAPNFSNAALPDYHTRWDKVEITYSPGDPGSRANLSAADFFSVPLQVATFTAASPETPSATLTWRAPTAAIFSKLAALSHASPVAVVGGSSGIPTQGYGPILRIISPSKVADPSVYPSFKAFVDFVKDQEIATLIWGFHNASQSYRLKAIVDKEDRLVMTGNGQRRSRLRNQYHDRRPGSAERNLHLESAIHGQRVAAQSQHGRSLCDRSAGRSGRLCPRIHR